MIISQFFILCKKFSVVSIINYYQRMFNAGALLETRPIRTFPSLD